MTAGLETYCAHHKVGLAPWVPGRPFVVLWDRTSVEVNANARQPRPVTPATLGSSRAGAADRNGRSAPAAGANEGGEARGGRG